MKRALGIAAFSLFVAGALFAQEPVAILEYYDDDFEVVITDADGNDYEFISFGMELLPGDTITTYASTAEIRLDPNGTIIKVGEDSEFTIDSISGYQGAESNNFSMTVGRIRTVAASVAGASYNIRTPTSVGGVRGTDFVMDYIPGEVDELGVIEGEVEFVNTETGESVTLGAGQGANTFAEVFEAVEWAQEKFQQFLQDLDFQELNPTEVPEGQQVSETDDGEPEDTEPEDTDDQPADTGPVVVEPPPAETGDGEDGDGEGEPDEGDAPAPSFVDDAMDWLGDIFAADIGSVTLDGQTYAKAVLQPTFELGDFRLGLYLPIIYQNNLFDPTDWYRPKGNNEWSFGTDEAFAGEENEVLLRIGDILNDLALKIRFMEYGDLRDPFFFKVGNVSGLTVGHGLLMRNYANDADFPAVRRTGVNLGVDFGAAGFEAVVNDLGEPEIFGGRFYLRPFHPTFGLAFGPSAVADIDPAGDLPETNTDGEAVFVETRQADPAFLNVAFDLDLGIIETDPFSLVLFADAGGMMPILDEAITDVDGNAVPAGLRTEVLFDATGDSVQFNNFGVTAGVLGNIFIFDYRFEFQWFDGFFKPGFYDESYDRLRGERARDVVNYLRNPGNPEYDQTTLGVYGTGSATIAEVFSIELGYLWPWYFDENDDPQYSDNDRFVIKLGAEEGLIPLGITANISYERTKFIPMIIGEDQALTLFDANTVFKGEVVVPLAPILDFAAVISTAVRRDSAGNVIYGPNDAPEIAPTVSIETRIGF